MFFYMIYISIPLLLILYVCLLGLSYVKKIEHLNKFFLVCFRPDLVDLRKVRTQSNSENLQMAFDIAEKEFGVTKLLDPEGI